MSEIGKATRTLVQLRLCRVPRDRDGTPKFGWALVEAVAGILHHSGVWAGVENEEAGTSRDPNLPQHEVDRMYHYDVADMLRVAASADLDLADPEMPPRPRPGEMCIACQERALARIRLGIDALGTGLGGAAGAALAAGFLRAPNPAIANPASERARTARVLLLIEDIAREYRQALPASDGGRLDRVDPDMAVRAAASEALKRSMWGGP